MGECILGGGARFVRIIRKPKNIRIKYYVEIKDFMFLDKEFVTWMWRRSGLKEMAIVQGNFN